MCCLAEGAPSGAPWHAASVCHLGGPPGRATTLEQGPFSLLTSSSSFSSSSSSSFSSFSSSSSHLLTLNHYHLTSSIHNGGAASSPPHMGRKFCVGGSTEVCCLGRGRSFGGGAAHSQCVPPRRPLATHPGRATTLGQGRRVAVCNSPRLWVPGRFRDRSLPRNDPCAVLLGRVGRGESAHPTHA